MGLFADKSWKRVDTNLHNGHLVTAPSFCRWYVPETHSLMLPHSYVWHDSFTAKRSIDAFIRVTWRHALPYSYVWHALCDIYSIHSFICVTWHTLPHVCDIHVCDMTHSQPRNALTRMAWRPKIFSDASFFLLYFIQTIRKHCPHMNASRHDYECVIFIFVTWHNHI